MARALIGAIGGRHIMYRCFYCNFAHNNFHRVEQKDPHVAGIDSTPRCRGIIHIIWYAPSRPCRNVMRVPEIGTIQRQRHPANDILSCCIQANPCDTGHVRELQGNGVVARSAVRCQFINGDMKGLFFGRGARRGGPLNLEACHHRVAVVIRDHDASLPFSLAGDFCSNIGCYL